MFRLCCVLEKTTNGEDLVYRLEYDFAWAYDLKPIWGGTKFLPEKFVTVIVSPKKKKKKKKKGHRPFRCTLSITFRLNMPSNVGPKWY